jgi:MFS family permease
MSAIKEERLFSREFLLLNAIFFLASMTMSVFFQFHEYLRFLGISPAWFGAIIAADSVASFVLQPFLSPFLHSGNAKRWMVAGIVSMTAALLLYKGAKNVAPLIAVRILHGAGFVCLMAAMTAMLVDFIPGGKSGRAFGLISMVRLVPYAVMPPLIGFLNTTAGDFADFLRYNALLMVLSLMVLFFIRPSPQGPQASDPEKGCISGALKEGLGDRQILILLLLNLLLYSGYTIIFFFLKGYGTSIAIDNPGLFFTVATITMIAVRLAGGAFFDRINKRTLTLVSMAGLALCYGLLAHTQGPGLFLFLAFTTGLGWGIVMPVLNALMFDYSLPRFRGLNLNLSLVMMQGGFFLGPLAGGFILAGSGYGLLFYLCALTSLGGAGLTFLLSRRRTGKE